MNSYVLDTSVAAAWYLPEEFSSSAGKWQNKLLEGSVTLYIPQLYYLEFSNVLRTDVRRGELEAKLAMEVYSSHLGSGSQRLQCTRAASKRSSPSSFSAG